jgi:hypothetical protein
MSAGVALDVPSIEPGVGPGVVVEPARHRRTNQGGVTHHREQHLKAVAKFVLVHLPLEQDHVPHGFDPMAIDSP